MSSLDNLLNIGLSCVLLYTGLHIPEIEGYVCKLDEILSFFVVMGDLASFITAVLPGCKIQPVMDVLEGIGVNTVEDLDFVEPDDLGGVLKKVESRKLLARAKSK